MIYTITTNPAIDMNVTVNKLLLGDVNRSYGAVYSPNGKGINVSFVLKHFGIDSTILGFFGGFSGEYILSECKKRGHNVLPVEVEGVNRVNVFIGTDEGEYKVVNEGPFVSKKDQEKFIEILKNIEIPEIVVISGSLSKGMDDDYYDEILKCCKDNGTKVVLDISSKKLKKLLKYRPLLIKPNDEEIREVFSFSINSDEDAITVLRYLHNEGAQNVLITMGEKGSYFYNGKCVWYCETHKIKLKSSACAGDGYLAAFLSVWLKDNCNIEAALKLASATGADIAESDGLGKLLNVEKYKDEITVRKVWEE